MALCPMLKISPHSRPSYLVELVARTLASFAGRLGLAAANKGNNSEDPWIEQEFEADPQTYHGHVSSPLSGLRGRPNDRAGQLRVSTGLACLKGIMWVEHHLSSLTLPVRVMHGLADRVTDTEGSKLLLERASSTDKELQLYEGVRPFACTRGEDVRLTSDETVRACHDEGRT